MNTNTRRALRQAHDYMLPMKEQTHVSETYTATPPALFIIDEANNHWTLGFIYQRLRDSPGGEFSFNVLLNGKDTGEFASRIERRSGKVRIFARGGFKIWNGRSFF
jgi:hypothetical protein